MRVLAGAVMFVAGCGAGGGTLSGTGGDTGIGTGSGGVGNFPGMGCGAVATAELLPPDILIALDASSSMNDDLANMACVGGCGQASKWAAAVAAITNVVTSTASRVNWGLELFAIQPASVCGSYTGVNVNVDTSSAPAIDLALRKQTTENGGVSSAGPRQTRSAVDAARAYLTARTDPNSKLIVLITDGAPLCASDGISVADDTASTVAAIGVAAAAGVPTHVIGVATAGGPADASIIMMGNAGRDELTGGPGYSAWTANDITETMLWVTSQATGCTFAVPEVPADGVLNRSNIRVRLNATENLTEIPHDTTRTNGWDYVDARLAGIRLYGPSCAAAKAAGPRSVSIAFVCILV